METLYYSRMKSPIGPLWVAVSKKGVVMIDWGYRTFPPANYFKDVQWVVSEEKTAVLRKKLTEYFAGERTEFDISTDLRTGTEFQRRCWEILSKIPYGELRTYQEIAVAAGRPTAFRAVGQANHANPIPIVIPCHRVISSDGHLGGYGGGLELKEQLLALEEALPGAGPLFAKAAKSGN